MKPQRMAFAPIALFALTACSVSPAARPQDDPSSMPMNGVRDASDLNPAEEVLVHEVLEVMMKEMYPAPSADSKSSLVGDGNALTVTVYVIGLTMRIAAEKIVKRFTRGEAAGGRSKQ